MVDSLLEHLDAGRPVRECALPGELVAELHLFDGQAGVYVAN